MSVPHRLFASKLMPTDGWDHSEQPVTDSPLAKKTGGQIFILDIGG